MAKAYNTEAKVIETLRLAESLGINTMSGSINPIATNVLRKYREKHHGKIQWILCPFAPLEDGLAKFNEEVDRLMDWGCDAVYIWGVRSDQMVAEKRVDLIGKAVESVKARNVNCGVGGHRLDVVVECEKQKVPADFYIKTFHHSEYPSANLNYDSRWCDNPKEVIEVMQGVTKPWIAFKVMAAGGIPPASAFPFAYNHGADCVLAGMFDFEMAQDVRLAQDAIAKRNANALAGVVSPMESTAMTQAARGPAMLAQEAMGTVFAVTATHADADYAQQAIRAALDELAWLEDRLSRFRPASDIGQLNRLRPGQSLTVAPETLACLQTALEIEEATQAAFDIGYASATSTRPRIALDQAASSVHVLAAGVQLDLGAIGKGFALDRMAAVLAEWDLDGIMLWASTSTVFARGKLPHVPSASVRIGPESARRSVLLDGAAMSASGTSVQGFHIIDPRSRRPARHRTRCWAKAPTAAEADALSTAFMVMTDAETAAYCQRHPHVSAYF